MSQGECPHSPPIAPLNIHVFLAETMLPTQSTLHPNNLPTGKIAGEGDKISTEGREKSQRNGSRETSLLQIQHIYSGAKMATGWLNQSVVMPHLQHADCQPCQKSLT